MAFCGPSPWVCTLRVRVPPAPPPAILFHNSGVAFFFFFKSPGYDGCEVCWRDGRPPSLTHAREEEENLPGGPPGKTAE